MNPAPVLWRTPYLVVVAERYGSEGPDGLSYTEMEYRFARETGVPLAALLLEGAARSRWPADRIDFDKRAKVDAFRALCQEGRMVAFWSDTGTLTTKSMLALNNLIGTAPRHGWISGDQATSPQLAAELARLSEENARLRAQVDALQGQSSADATVEQAATRLRQPLRIEVEKASRRFAHPFAPMLANAEAVQALDATSIFDFAMERPEPFLDGASEDDLNDILFRFLLKRLDGVPEPDSRTYAGSLVSMLTFLMRTWGLLDATNTQVTRASGPRMEKWLRFSPSGRSAFERATTEFLDGS